LPKIQALTIDHVHFGLIEIKAGRRLVMSQRVQALPSSACLASAFHRKSCPKVSGKNVEEPHSTALAKEVPYDGFLQ
jgi:hypothetical protein